MKFFLALGLLLVSFICSAAIYMQSDTNSTDATSYSDMPTKGSQVVNVSGAPAISVSAPATSNKTITTTTSKTSTSSTPTDKHQPYTNFSITSPVDQQTFQNQREIPVAISVTPALQKGDTIEVFADGAQAGPAAASTQFTLHQLTRGTHVVTAVLLGADNTSLNQAGPVTFFVHYAAVGGG